MPHNNSRYESLAACVCVRLKKENINYNITCRDYEKKERKSIAERDTSQIGRKMLWMTMILRISWLIML